ncbi:hypothetical protein ABZ726_16840 [Streptomyces hundungensis]|uniref:hypothetical protein n=1 Tax=Streptomyces hundungensis TaxID=1077946 RepID=UPI00340EDF1D
MASDARHLADAMTAHGEAAAAVAFVTAAANRSRATSFSAGPKGCPCSGCCS